MVRSTCFWGAVAAVACVMGCGDGDDKGPADAGRTDAATADVAQAADAGTQADTPPASGTDAALAAACPETVPLPAGATGRARLDVAFTLDDKALVFGERNTRTGGGSVTPTNIRFYLSTPTLTDGSGNKVAATLVDEAGAPLPYGLQLVNAEEAKSLRLLLAAPPGRYTGLTFLFGLSEGCNSGDPSTRKPPLTHTSQMTWPPPFPPYLFFRLEAMVMGGGDAGAAGLNGIHMGALAGGDKRAPTVTANGTLDVAASTGRYELRVAIDQIFEAASRPTSDTGGFSPPGEILAGEALRQHAATLPIFSVRPLP